MTKLLLKIKNHLVSYPTPGNLNNFFNFGFLSGVCLVLQILTGIFLTMHYTPHTDAAFDSVQHIMRDVNNGWYMRYAHSNGASLFFFCLYVHIARALYFRSYEDQKYALWFSGILIFLLTMLTAFVGYVLPWGQMSFWGATVITNLVSAIPIFGKSIVTWLWGGFSISNATLNRFFAIHFFMPFVILGIMLLHLLLLHENGSTNPSSNVNFIDNIKFLPYYIFKDILSLLALLFVLTFLIHFKPNMLGHPDNYIKANPLVTPIHIVPEWYFLPFYAILRSVPNKLGGVILMLFAIFILFLFPLFSTNIFKVPPRMRPYFRIIFWIFVANFILLGWVGGQPVEEPYTVLGQNLTAFYFLYFLLIIPCLEMYETAKLKTEMYYSGIEKKIDSLEKNIITLIKKEISSKISKKKHVKKKNMVKKNNK